MHWIFFIFVYTVGSQIMISKKYSIFSLDLDFVVTNTQNIGDPDEMRHNRLMGHFIWIFTVCQSSCSGVSGLQRVKIMYSVIYH